MAHCIKCNKLETPIVDKDDKPVHRRADNSVIMNKAEHYLIKRPYGTPEGSPKKMGPQEENMGLVHVQFKPKDNGQRGRGDPTYHCCLGQMVASLKKSPKMQIEIEVDDGKGGKVKKTVPKYQYRLQLTEEAYLAGQARKNEKFNAEAESLWEAKGGGEQSISLEVASQVAADSVVSAIVEAAASAGDQPAEIPKKKWGLLG